MSGKPEIGLVRETTQHAAQIVVAVAALILADPLRAQDQLTGPRLAAVSNMSQGNVPGLLATARALGVEDFRDGVQWGRVEPAPGVWEFSDIRVGFPDDIGMTGAGTSLVLNWGNPVYQNGATPTDEAAIRAFGRLAGVIVERFPAVDSLEIGNEFNGVNFVRGPIAQLSPQDRALAYVPLLAAAAEEARAVRPNIRILGGATHSIASGYIWTMLDAGAGHWMDAIAIHPYTTPPELLVPQIEVLRRHPEAAVLPIEVTEFGSEQPDTAAGDFLRQYCQMALSGVTRVAWYPLNTRGDGFVPLINREGEVTDAGRAWSLAAALMEGRPVVDAAPDDFVYGCLFGEDVLVLWGPERQITVTGGVEVYDAAGRVHTGPQLLSPEAPLVFIDPDGEVALKVVLGPTHLLADSFYQFAYPLRDELRADGDGFDRFVVSAGREYPLSTFPGQDRGGVPWFPYRSNSGFPVVMLTQSSLLPGGRGEQPRVIVHRWTAPEAMSVNIASRFAVSERSEDGITVEVLRNGATLQSRTGTSPVEFNVDALSLNANDNLEFRVGPNRTSTGDLTGYRITIAQTGFKGR